LKLEKSRKDGRSDADCEFGSATTSASIGAPFKRGRIGKAIGILLDLLSRANGEIAGQTIVAIYHARIPF
jgi:hypothetical protein